MATKTRTARSKKSSDDGKMNGASSKEKKAPSEVSKRKRAPRNAEEAFMLAWEKTYANRHKRFKLWEDR